MITPSGKQAVLAFLLFALVALGYVVLRPFATPIAWAFIIAYVTWPLYERIRDVSGGRQSLAAFLMTAMLALGLVVPMLLLTMPLTREAIAFFRGMATWLADGHRTLPRALSTAPWLGAWLQTLLDDITHQPSAWRAELAQWGNHWIGEAAQLAGSIGRNAVGFGFALLTLFFAFRDGETLLEEIRRVLSPYLGKRLDTYLTAIGDVCRSVVLGIVVTAAAQGALAGIGYWAAGVGAPLLLAVLTGLAALLPFGTPLVWAPIGIVLLVSGDPWAGVGLLVWGTLVVSWVDNLIRPLVISNSGHMPFLLVIFSIVGGIAAFGLVGLFTGPFVVATLLAVWREWQAEPLAAHANTKAASRESETLSDSNTEQHAEP